MYITPTQVQTQMRCIPARIEMLQRDLYEVPRDKMTQHDAARRQVVAARIPRKPITREPYNFAFISFLNREDRPYAMHAWCCAHSRAFARIRALLAHWHAFARLRAHSPAFARTRARCSGRWAAREMRRRSAPPKDAARVGKQQRAGPSGESRSSEEDSLGPRKSGLHPCTLGFPLVHSS